MSFLSSSRIIPTLAAASAAALLLTSCSTDPSANGDATVGGTLVYASGDAEPTCLDPHVGGNYPQALVASQYLETLFTKTDSGEIVPWLVETSEVSDDGLTHTLTVRDGITFHDGTALTSEAIKANIEHLQDPDTASSTGWLAVQKVDSIDLPDDKTAVLNLSAPDNALEESLSMMWTAIQSPDALARDQETNCAAPVGTGPFQVESWDRQEAVNMVRNENYVLPSSDANVAAHPEQTPGAYLDGITWRFIPEAATRYSALVSGEVHVIDNPQPDTISTAEQNNLGHLDAPRPGSANRIELNSSKAPFDDPLVREAFIRAVDVDGGVSSLYFGTTERSHSLLSSVEPFNLQVPELLTTDVDAANELLDEAGWTERDAEGFRAKDGERLALTFPVSTNQSVPAEQSLFEQFQAQADEVGFDLTINLLDLSSWYGALAEHDYDLVSAPYTKVGPSVLRILYHSDSTVPAPSGYFANNAQVTVDEIDEKLITAEQTSSEEERQQLYEEVQQQVLEDFYVLPLYDQQNHFLYSDQVNGMGETTAVSSPIYYNVSLNQE